MNSSTKVLLDEERKRVKGTWEEWEFAKNLIITSGSMLLTLHKVSDLPDTDFCCTSWLCGCAGSAPDSFCALSIKDDPRKTPWKAKTVVMEDDDCPCFNQCFTVSLPRPRQDVIFLELFDKDMFRNDKIGHCMIPVWDVIHLVRGSGAGIVTMGVEDGALKIMYIIHLTRKYSLKFNSRRVTIYVSIRPRFSAYAAKIAMKQTQKFNKTFHHSSSNVQQWNAEMSGSLASTNDSPPISHSQSQERWGSEKQLKRVQTVANTKSGKLRVAPDKLAQSQIPNSVPADSEADARAMAEFRKYDMDGNGVISKAELQYIYRSLEEHNMFDARNRIDQVIEKHGMLDDEKITFDEFVILMAELMELKYITPEGYQQKQHQRQQPRENPLTNPEMEEAVPAQQNGEIRADAGLVQEHEGEEEEAQSDAQGEVQPEEQEEGEIGEEGEEEEVEEEEGDELPEAQHVEEEEETPIQKM
eukprot:TRINITY_DN67445_c3_g1_i2.p2 TRINITY_DN67445_c3_g1~~TRINITY_DN67445_c3_g1_i2.p2  ORF type:complete len:470 (-),score=56.26 TRINITY_DN67445_c3_g1_i2:2899-4308(-)